MYELLIFHRPTTTGLLGNYTSVARNWRRTSQAVGGYWLGSFVLSSEDLTQRELIDFYECNLRFRLEEHSAGELTWEGYIMEMRLALDGVEYMRTMRPEWFHNKVKVIYRSIEYLGSELLSNIGFETAGGGGADIWANWTENAGDGALADEGAIVHTGSHACKATADLQLLGNTGFETAGGGGADIWANWTENAGDGALADEGTIVYGGSHACKATAGASQNTYVKQAIAVTAEHSYKLTFYTRGDGTYDGQYKIYDVTNGADIVALTSTGVTGTAYQAVTVEFDAPVGCASVEIYLYCPDTDTGIAYFDHVHAWAAPDTYVKQAIAVTAEHSYKLTFYTRGDGTYAGQYKIWDDINNEDIKALGSTGVTGTTYTQVTAYFDAPADCSSVEIYLYCPDAAGGVAYFDTSSAKEVTVEEGSRQTIAFSENTDSSDEYGEMEAILTLPKTTSAAATAMRDAQLKGYAWPRSRLVSGLAFPRPSAVKEDQLLVVVAGYWHTLNWRYREASIEDTVSNLITTLVGLSEFVSAGRIETNSLAAYAECDPIGQRLGDLIEDLIAQGDASGNVWKGGVYGDREFVYEQAPTEPRYFLHGGRLVDVVGVEVLPPLLEPGFLLYNASAPTAALPPGTSSAWDDPRVCYVDEVEFIAPDGLRLKLYGEEPTIEILTEQIRRERLS